jgi:hypothetical protein
LLNLLVGALVLLLVALPVKEALAAPARPVLDGTFVQNWLVQNWDDETWDREFAYLAETGMSYLIVQGTADGQPGGATRTYFPSFAYTHYYSPNVVVPGFHSTYLDYVRTGRLEENPPSPPAKVSAAALPSGGVLVYWEAASDDHGIFSYEVYRDGELVGVTRVPKPTEKLDPLFWESFVDDRTPGGKTVTYQVRAVDFAGNRSGLSEAVTITAPAA